MKLITATQYFLAVASISLVACQQSESPITGQSEVELKEQHSIEDAVAASTAVVESKIEKHDHHHQNNTVKPGPPLSISYKVLGTPQIGQPINIELEVTSTITNQPLNVHYQAINPQALSIVPTADGKNSFQLEADISRKQSIGKRMVSVVPQREGQSLIRVTMEMGSGNDLMSVTRSIAIQVGNKKPEKKINGELSTDENGEAIISMPSN